MQHKTNPFMKLAIQQARNGIRHGHGGPFGAVIVKDGVVVGKGHNQVVKNNDPTCHGEMMAIRSACKKLGTFDLSGCELYTTGQPCPMCLAASMWANINRIYYGCNVQDTAEIGFRDEQFFEFQQDPKAQEAYLHETDRRACLRLYNEYKGIADKTHY